MIQTKNVLKEYFETGDKPTQQQYENLIDSLRHAYDKIPLDDLEEDVVSQSEFQSHLDNAAFNGDVTAVNFIGDGSQLTGISLDNLPNDVAYTDLSNNFSVKQIIDNSNTDGIDESLKIDGTGSASSALIKLNRGNTGRMTGIYHSTNDTVDWFEGIYYDGGSPQSGFGIGTSRDEADQILKLTASGNNKIKGSLTQLGGDINLTISQTNSTTSEIFGQGNLRLRAGNSANLVFYSNNIENAILDLNGNFSLNGNLNVKGNDLNFLGGTTDWKTYTSGDDLYIRETAIGDRVAFYSGGLTKFNLNSSVAEFNSDADASIKLSSNDPYTGIAFQDPLGNGYMFFHGTNGYYLDNNLHVTADDSQLIVTDINSSNVGIGDTQSAILLKGMYASGSVEDTYSQARLRLVKDQADGTAGSAFAIDVMNNAGGASVLTERLVINSEGNFDFKNGAGTFGGLITGTAGMTLGSTASTTTRNPQYLVFGGSAGSEYGMELGYDSVRAKYSTRIITSSSQDISFGAMNAPATHQTDFTEWLVIENDGNFDFKNGNATFGGTVKIANELGAKLVLEDLDNGVGIDSIFGQIDYISGEQDIVTASIRGVSDTEDGVGGLRFYTGATATERYKIDYLGNHDFKDGNAIFGGTITVSSDNNILADFTSTDSIGEIRIGDNIAYTRLLTGGVDFKIMPNNGAEVAVFEGDTLQTLLKGALDVTTTGTFGGNVTAPNFLGDLIGDQITAGTNNGSVQIRNNSGQPIATFTDTLSTSFTGDISLEDDKFLYLGNSNNARLFANGTNTFFDGLTGNMYFRNQFDGGNIYFQVENTSGADLDLIEIHGDTQDVLLRHGNSSKLQTTSAGVNIYGELSVIKSGGASLHADTDLFVADSTAAGSTSQIQILGGNTGNSNLFFSDTDSYSSGGIKYRHTSDEMILRVGNVDLVSLEDKGVTIGSGSVSGQPRLNYQKDANNSNGWYLGYLNSSPSNNDFGIYSFESADFRVYTNDTLALTLDNTQNASFSGEITASGAIMSNAGFSTGVQSANSGAIRLENDDKITSRNSANSGNRTLMYLDSANVLQLAEATDTNFGGKITAKDLQINLQGADVAYIYGENDAQLRIRDISGNGPWSGIGFGTSTGTDGHFYHNSVGQFFQVTHQLQLLSGAYVPDSEYIYFGSSNDFRISHDGSNTLMDNYNGDLHFRNFTDGGSIYFYADNSTGVSTAILTLDATTADINGEVNASSFTQNGTDVYLNIGQHNTSTSKIFADANLRIEAGASANILFHVNGAERGRIDLNGLMTLNDGLTVTGNVTATNFVGDGSLLTNLPSQSPTGYVVTGTPAGADLELTLGVPSGVGNSTRIYIDDDTNSINLAADETTIGGSTLVITGDIDGSAAIFSGDVDADNLISQNDITANGTLKIGQIDLGGLNTIPASSSSTGATGQIRIDANHIYVCTATNTWKRVALATW